MEQIESSMKPKIPGIKVDNRLANVLRNEVALLLGRKNHANLPCSHGVTFGTKHLSELKLQDYYLCEKSQGTRCFMYLTSDGQNEVIYLIDRQNDYYHVKNLHFPMPKDGTSRSFHTKTIIDGELELDDIGDGKKLLRYYALDCLVLDGQSLMDKTFNKRLSYYREHILNPFQNLCKTFPDKVPRLPFQVELKKLRLAYNVQRMLTEKLSHGSDGLVFTSRKSPYHIGTAHNIITWRPPGKISIDFRLNLEHPPRSRENIDEDALTSALQSLTLVGGDKLPTFHLSVNMGASGHKRWAQMYVTAEEWKRLRSLSKPIDGSIVECVMDEQKRWRFVRVRDKKNGNHISTVNSIMECIKEGVKEEDLIKACAEIRAAWKARMDEQNKQVLKEAGPKIKEAGQVRGMDNQKPIAKAHVRSG